MAKSILILWLFLMTKGKFHRQRLETWWKIKRSCQTDNWCLKTSESWSKILTTVKNTSKTSWRAKKRATQKSEELWTSAWASSLRKTWCCSNRWCTPISETPWCPPTWASSRWLKWTWPRRSTWSSRSHSTNTSSNKTKNSNPNKTSKARVPAWRQKAPKSERKHEILA